MSEAKEIIIPNEKGVFRIIFLYVGQGSSTLLVIPDGQNWRYMLIDTNTDAERGGIDIPKLLKDLLDDGLDIFVNTHPHNDHLKGVKEIHGATPIKEIWHSGHKPGKDHNDAYKELQDIMKEIGADHVFLLKGSKEENKLDESEYKLGDIGFNILAPAEYVCDEIEEEKPEDRYNRIHEQCGVIRFFYGTEQTCILIPGDADKIAWQQHITDYHADRLPAAVFSAPHHGSNTFFKVDDQDESYEDHIKKIKPEYLIVSAPKKSESPHGHPDEEAMKTYKQYIEKDGIFHLGQNRECVIVDIFSDGTLDIKTDKDLVQYYGLGQEKENNKYTGPSVGAITSRIDRKAMGKHEVV